MKKKLAEILLLCCAVALLMGSDSADERFERLGSKIMCSCGCSEMLLKCNHLGCPNSDPMIRQLGALVGSHRHIVKGAVDDPTAAANLQPMSSDQDVLNWFRANWGVTAVVEPGTHGLELWAWILPGAALGLGFLAVAFTIRLWRQRSANARPPRTVKLDPHLEALRERARRETEI